MKIKVKCPVCKWKGEITHDTLAVCPKCFCDLVAVKPLLKLTERRVGDG